MGIALIIFGVISIIAGASEGVQQPIIFGVVMVFIGLAVSGKANERKQKAEQVKLAPPPPIPVREKPIEDIDLKQANDSNEIMNRFKNNDFCKTLLKELTEEDLYKSIEVYEDKITIGRKKYVYEDYGLRELELNDTSTLANYLGINLTNDSSYLIERIKKDNRKTIGYRVYKDK